MKVKIGHHNKHKLIHLKREEWNLEGEIINIFFNVEIKVLKLFSFCMPLGIYPVYLEIHLQPSSYYALPC